MQPNIMKKNEVIPILIIDRFGFSIASSTIASWKHPHQDFIKELANNYDLSNIYILFPNDITRHRHILDFFIQNNINTIFIENLTLRYCFNVNSKS